jgi:HIV Tat-specific factor 1
MSFDNYVSYLNNVLRCAEGYKPLVLKSTDSLETVMDAVRDIDDLHFMDALLVKGGDKNLFFKSKNYLTEPLVTSLYNMVENYSADDELKNRIIDNLGSLLEEKYTIPVNRVLSSNLVNPEDSVTSFFDRELVGSGVLSSMLSSTPDYENYEEELDDEDNQWGEEEDEFDMDMDEEDEFDMDMDEEDEFDMDMDEEDEFDMDMDEEDSDEFDMDMDEEDSDEFDMDMDEEDEEDISEDEDDYVMDFDDEEEEDNQDIEGGDAGNTVNVNSDKRLFAVEDEFAMLLEDTAEFPMNLDEDEEEEEEELFDNSFEDEFPMDTDEDDDEVEDDEYSMGFDDEEEEDPEEFDMGFDDDDEEEDIEDPEDEYSMGFDDEDDEFASDEEDSFVDEFPLHTDDDEDEDSSDESVFDSEKDVLFVEKDRNSIRNKNDFGDFEIFDDQDIFSSRGQGLAKDPLSSKPSEPIRSSEDKVASTIIGISDFILRSPRILSRKGKKIIDGMQVKEGQE